MSRTTDLEIRQLNAEYDDRCREYGIDHPNTESFAATHSINTAFVDHVESTREQAEQFFTNENPSGEKP